MRLGAVAMVGGAWALQQQADLPSSAMQGLLAALGVLLLGLRIGRGGWPTLVLSVFGCALIGFTWAAWRADLRMRDELPHALEGVDVRIVGTVSTLPDRFERGQRFAFQVERVDGPDVSVNGAGPLKAPPHIPSRIALGWYSAFGADQSDSAPPAVRAGERWAFTVRLKRPHGNANPGGFDYEGWLLAENLRATGYVRQGDGLADRPRRLDAFVPTPGHVIERVRGALRERIEAALATDSGARPYSGVIVALVIGDQRAIAQSDWTVFNRTGISHLVSISGLHVTMLAGLGAAALFALWRRHPALLARLAAQRAAALAGSLVALLYCLLAGWGVPAQRTLVMIATVALALWLGRRTAPSRVLCVALLAVVLLDPWAVEAAGFWLSYGAVAAIFFAMDGRIERRVTPASSGRDRLRARLHAGLREAGRLQWAVTLGLVPLTLLLFQQVSLIGPVANAVAIPLVSFVVTPLALVGALLPGAPGAWVLIAAHAVMELLAIWLGWLSRLPLAVWSAPAAPAWAFVLAVLGALWALAPPGFGLRWIGLVAMVPALFWPPDVPPPGQLRLTVFDVGQGTAVLIETHAHVYLYDTGPAYSAESDGGNRVVLPFLRWRGIGRLDGMVVSHNDNDHSGGALSILDAIPVAWTASSLSLDSAIVRRAPHHLRCAAGQGWEVDGVRFAILHPDADSYSEPRLKPNARSCVLRVALADGAQSALLTADIERPHESALLAREPLAHLRAPVLLVPHHGSMTSSSDAFIDAVAPRVALVQAGYLSRFGHPRPAILARYAARGIAVYRTDRDGALTLDMDRDGIAIAAWRKVAPRYWRQP